MRLLSLQNELEAFLAMPTASGFSSLRKLLISDEEYHPLQATIEDLTAHLKQRRYRELLSAAEDLMPAWMLCVRVHSLCEKAALALEDAENIELYGFLRDSCLQGLLSSGDGTKSRPFQVTYPSDQNDILAAESLKAQSRELVISTDKWLERVTCDVNRIIWFDVDDLLRSQTKRTSPKGAATVIGSL